jgi:hypothetical protein
VQEFRMQVQEMKDFIGDKKRLVREDSFKDGIGNIKVNIHSLIAAYNGGWLIDCALNNSNGNIAYFPPFFLLVFALFCLQAKAKKHEVLEGEIKANAGQLKAINRTGHHMINRWGPLRVK